MPFYRRVAVVSIPSQDSEVTVRRSEDLLTTVNMPAYGLDLQAVERALIVFALHTTGGNRTRAASLLSLTRSALIYRIRKHRISTPVDSQ